jgi:hypothetical protein
LDQPTRRLARSIHTLAAPSAWNPCWCTSCSSFQHEQRMEALGALLGAVDSGDIVPDLDTPMPC